MSNLCKCIKPKQKTTNMICGFLNTKVRKNAFNTDCKCFTCKGHHCDTCKEPIIKKCLYQKCINCQKAR